MRGNCFLSLPSGRQAGSKLPILSGTPGHWGAGEGDTELGLGWMLHQLDLLELGLLRGSVG